MERAVAMRRLNDLLRQHRGRRNAVGMGELYEAVFEIYPISRINGTRRLRKLITDLRRKGRPVCSNMAGYYLAANAVELADYNRRVRRRALGELERIACQLRISMPELLGQLRLDLEM